jgi:hypothetical protein
MAPKAKAKRDEPEFVYVMSGRDDARVAFTETHDDHPDGEAYVAHSETMRGKLEKVPYKVANTRAVGAAIKNDVLVEVDEADYDDYHEQKAKVREQARSLMRDASQTGQTGAVGMDMGQGEDKPKAKAPARRAARGAVHDAGDDTGTGDGDEGTDGTTDDNA